MGSSPWTWAEMPVPTYVFPLIGISQIGQRLGRDAHDSVVPSNRGKRRMLVSCRCDLRYHLRLEPPPPDLPPLNPPDDRELELELELRPPPLNPPRLEIQPVGLPWDTLER